jgi:hypothetical protein
MKMEQRNNVLKNMAPFLMNEFYILLPPDFNC